MRLPAVRVMLLLTSAIAASSAKTTWTASTCPTVSSPITRATCGTLTIAIKEGCVPSNDCSFCRGYVLKAHLEESDPIRRAVSRGSPRCNNDIFFVAVYAAFASAVSFVLCSDHRCCCSYQYLLVFSSASLGISLRLFCLSHTGRRQHLWRLLP
jgi:hypothetical protein